MTTTSMRKVDCIREMVKMIDVMAWQDEKKSRKLRICKDSVGVGEMFVRGLLCLYVCDWVGGGG